MKRMVAGEICLPLMLAAMMMISCERREKRETTLDLSMKDYEVVMKTQVKSESFPDTNDFVLEITDEAGSVVYSGEYGARPQSIKVFDGLYTLAVRSDNDMSPAFDHPIYGDVQAKDVVGGGVVRVDFICHQINSGVKMDFDEEFKVKFENGCLIMKDDSGMVLEYGYEESRIAYFRPGNVRFSIRTDKKEVMLLEKVLEQDRIVRLHLSTTKRGEICTSMDVDTVKRWDDYFYMEDGKDGSTSNKAIPVSRLSLYEGQKDIWVDGYIVGGDMGGSGGMTFADSVSVQTHIAISDDPFTQDQSACAPVQLSSGTDAKDALMLKGNGDPNYRRHIRVKGDIEMYFGTIGVKNIKEFVLL